MTSADDIIAEAEEATNLSAHHLASSRDGLDLIAAGLDLPALTTGGAARLRKEVVNYVANRLRIDDAHERDPSLAEQPVTAPVVILGLPRTGTTAISYLLDQDPHWRSLLNWEAVMSVPPPTTATLRTDPRCVEMLEFQQAIYPHIDPPPPHWEWADGPTECTFVLAQDFRSVMFDTRIPSPAYREFVENCDPTPAYVHHRRTLQVLQSQAPGPWVLKMPAHAYFIEGLLAVYPDAQIIWTHRDPFRSVASFLDLAGFAQGVSLRERDPEWIRTTYPPRLADYVRRAEQALAGRDVLHVHYRDMVDQPMSTMATIYDWLDTPLDPAVSEAMTAWLDADPIRKPRKRPYGLSDWGLAIDDLDPVFSDYAATYGVALEP